MMMRSTLTRRILAMVLVLVTAGCSSSSNPNTPTPTPPTGQTCRIYPSAAIIVETNRSAVPPLTLTTTLTNAFNASTNQLTNIGTIVSSTGCAGPFTNVTTWGSIADFVAEVAVVPPLQRQTRTEASANACGRSAMTTTYAYDGQNRLTQVQPAGITYTAWDSFGRPTAGSGIAGAGSFSISYDNSARKSFTTYAGNPPTIVTLTWDVNGNATEVSGAGTTAVFTTLSTATVCR